MDITDKIWCGGIGSEIWKRVGSSHLLPHRYNVENPDLVRSVYLDYVAAGAGFLVSNTFVCNDPEDITAGMDIAVEVASCYECCVAGSMSVIGKSISDLVAQACLMYDLGADVILMETLSTEDFDKLPYIRKALPDVSIVISTFCLGESALEKLVVAGEKIEAEAIGLNCMSHSEIVSKSLLTLRNMSDIPLLYRPNAGFPDIYGRYIADMRLLAEAVFKTAGTIPECGVGGCCGTDTLYIKELSALFGR